MFGQLFVVFYCGPGHLTPLRHRKGSCDQCRTVHEGFKPPSPCFLYGVNKNYACTGKESFGVFRSLDLQRRVGDLQLRDVMQLVEVAKVSFQLETSS